MPSRGELPETLIQAGLSLLDEAGAEGLTLRRIAARAGVSHAAPAHHFNGLPGLKVAIATRGFQSFLHDFEAALEELPVDTASFNRLLAVNMAYIRFAAARPALFHLMFAQLPTQDTELHDLALSTYNIHSHLCAPFVVGRPAAPFETAVWALTHGYATLALDKPRPPFESASYEAALRLLVE